jgi:hypothetical protein
MQGGIRDTELFVLRAFVVRDLLPLRIGIQHFACAPD